MSWLTIIWSLAAGMSLTLAAINVLVWLFDRRNLGNLLFAIIAASVAAMARTELGMMHAATPAEYGEWMRWSHVPIFFIIPGMVLFVRVHLGTGRLWLAWIIFAIRCVVLAGNFLVQPNFNWQEITSLERVVLLGEEVSVVGHAVVRSWQWLPTLSVVLYAGFVIDASLVLWRKGGPEERRRVLVLGVGMIGFVVVSILLSQLVIWGVVRMPILISPPFTILIAAMGFELCRDTLRANRVAEELRDASENLNLAAAAVHLGLWSRDLVRNQLWANAQWRHLFGFKPAEALNFEQYLQRLHPDDRESVRRSLAKAVADAGHYEMEYRVTLAGGQVRWIVSRGRVESDAAGRPVLMRGVSADVTRRREAELELQRNRTELAHLSRVSVLGELAGALAHELNQPLTAILSNAQVARQMAPATSSHDRAELEVILEDIKSDARRAGGIIHGLRAMFRKDGPTGAQPMDLNEAVVQTLELLNSEIIARKVKLVLQLGADLPPASAGRVEIQQVLINLVLNALDALKSDALRGLLEIATEHRTGWLHLTVRDNGPGIPEALKGCLFDPFVSSKQGGLGLGLAICRSIADRYHGKLVAENLPAGGALFRLTVPAAGTSFT